MEETCLISRHFTTIITATVSLSLIACLEVLCGIMNKSPVIVYTHSFNKNYLAVEQLCDEDMNNGCKHKSSLVTTISSFNMEKAVCLHFK